MTTIGDRLKRVFVRAYVRRRLGQLEHVHQHYRSWPGQQLTLAV